MFSKYQDTASVLRLSTTDDGYKRRGYVSTGNTYLGHLKAQSITQTQEIGDFGKQYKFTTESTADIQEGDRLQINSVDYDVKGSVVCRGITFDTLQCMITKIG